MNDEVEVSDLVARVTLAEVIVRIARDRLDPADCAAIDKMVANCYYDSVKEQSGCVCTEEKLTTMVETVTESLKELLDVEE